MGYLLAKDTVNGAEGRVYITRGGKSVEVAGMRNIRAGATVQSSDMKVIGTRTIQSKNNGAKLAGRKADKRGFRHGNESMGGKRIIKKT